MPYTLGETLAVEPVFFTDPMQGTDQNAVDYLDPQMMTTPGTDSGIPAPRLPDYTPISPRTAPQPLPDLVVRAPVPVPWGLLLVLVGGLALASGRGRGTQEF